MSTLAASDTPIGPGSNEPPAGSVTKYATRIDARTWHDVGEVERDGLKVKDGLGRFHARTMKSAAMNRTRESRSSSSVIETAGIRLERLRVLTRKAWRFFTLGEAAEFGYAAAVEAIDSTKLHSGAGVTTRAVCFFRAKLFPFPGIDPAGKARFLAPPVCAAQRTQSR